MKKKILIPVLLLFLLSTGIVAKPFVAKAGTAESHTTTKEDIKDKLVPTPQAMNIHEGTLQMTESVNILGQDTADRDAFRNLKEFLTEHDVKVNDELDLSSITIAIGEEDTLDSEVKDVESTLDISNSSDLKEEGYLLHIQSETNEFSKEGTIFLKGKDEVGTFYGIKTLIQLVDQKKDEITFENATIIDTPSMATRGIIEGFYGEPWDQEDRLDQINFYGDYKLNTYIYAPKDDPYHREKWREPYPANEMDRMETLIETANENKVDFVFAISPGIDISFDGEEGEKDFRALLDKSESLYDMGVRDFAILFDDIDNKDGKKHGELLNRFNEEFIKEKEDVNPLITVPTEYDTNVMGGSTDHLNPYTKDLSNVLDEDIVVMWTGQVVVPDGLPFENVELMQEIYGDQIGVWWNYPVTDYLTSKLALGPIVNIDKKLEEEVDFFTMNPMEHVNLSKITLATGADYTWNIRDYDPDHAWERSIELLFGDLAPEMKTFANHSTRMTGSWSIGREDAPNVQKVIDEFWEKISKQKDVSKEKNDLEEEFTNMVQASETLKEELPSEVLKESDKNLDKLKLLGESGQKALDMVLANVKEDKTTYAELKEEVYEKLSDLNEGARVSEETVLAFIEEAMEFDRLPSASFDVSKTLVAPGEEIEFSNTSSLTTEKVEWTFEGATYETSTKENPKVVYDKEGIYTVKLVGKNALGEDKVIKKEFITVTELAKKETTNLALDKEAEASSSCAPTEDAEGAVDGTERTKWCADGEQPHTLTVNLGESSLVNEVVIKHAEAGGEPNGMNTSAYRVLISEDGEDFEELVEVKGNKKGVTRDQVPVTKGQYVRLVVDQPTQGDDVAARIYEFEVNGLEGDIGLPPIYDPINPEPVEDAAELETLVEKIATDGSIAEAAVRPLTIHLKSVNQYEDQEKKTKIVKHMRGFKQLLAFHQEQGNIDEDAYETLVNQTNYLIDMWE